MPSACLERFPDNVVPCDASILHSGGTAELTESKALLTAMQSMIIGKQA
jgi:hypothetical protein